MMIIKKNYFLNVEMLKGYLKFIIFNSIKY